MLLVVIGQSLNILWPKLKGWIRQFLQDVKPAVLILLLFLLGLCCMARDSFIHYMVKGKVCMVFQCQYIYADIPGLNNCSKICAWKVCKFAVSFH